MRRDVRLDYVFAIPGESDTAWWYVLFHGRVARGEHASGEAAVAHLRQLQGRKADGAPATTRGTGAEAER